MYIKPHTDQKFYTNST